MFRHLREWSARAAVAVCLLTGPALAQTPSPSPTIAATPAATPTASPSAAAATAPASPAPSASPTVAAPSPSPSPPTVDSSAVGQMIDLPAHPAAYFEGKAGHDEVFDAIMGSLAMVRNEIAKAGLKPSGKPLAVFLEADDNGFKYRAEIPIDAIPEGKTQLSEVVKLGQTPAGKAMRFEHRGPYDDIDATYEAITAYLDEKGIDAQDVFVEQYLNEVKTSDDPNLQVDIFVMLK